MTRIEPIHRWRWRGLAVWIAIFTIAVAASLHELRHQAREGVTARQALCAFKLDLRYRVVASENYLRVHPQGFPGIPASTLRRAIVQQKHTLASLSKLHCKRELPPV